MLASKVLRPARRKSEQFTHAGSLPSLLSQLGPEPRAHCASQFTRTSTGDKVDAAPFALPSENFNIVLLQTEVDNSAALFGLWHLHHSSTCALGSELK